MIISFDSIENINKDFLLSYIKNLAMIELYYFHYLQHTHFSDGHCKTFNKKIQINCLGRQHITFFISTVLNP